jgi:hypothetical protein
MKALTLWEPWASLIASGDKLIETRSWETKYRGKLLITAAARKLDEGDKIEARNLLKSIGYTDGDSFKINLGKVVALCDLDDCMCMSQNFIDAQIEKERLVGNWQLGRYAWILKDVVDLRDKAISIKGKQGLWTPDENQQKAVMFFSDRSCPYC